MFTQKNLARKGLNNTRPDLLTYWGRDKMAAIFQTF